MSIATALRPPPTTPNVRSEQPIRIAYVIDNLSRAGTETQLLALIRALDRTQFEPRLILLDGTGAASKALEPDNCEVIRLGIRKLFSLRALKAAKSIQQSWRTDRPGIVQTYFLDASYFSVPIARSAGVPHIIRVRNNLGYWLTPKHRLLNRAIRRWVHLSLTNSEAGREALIRLDRLSTDEVVWIENGVDLERFADLAPPQFVGPIRIGCVANLRPVKNIDGLVRAARIVLDQFPDATFEVAGEGEQRTALERSIAELNLGSRVVLRGRVDDVPRFLGSIDLAVLPSHSEGMSNALLEYMAAGRAIVATDVGASAKLVRHQLEGWIVTPSDDASLANGILAVIHNPQAASAMALAARRRVEAEYSREVMRKKFEQLYLQLMKRVRVAPAE